MIRKSKSFFVIASQYSSFIPVIAGVGNYKRLTHPFKILVLFTCIACFTEFFASWYAANINRNNLPPLHVYTLVEFGFLFYVFCQYLLPKRAWILWIVGIFPAILVGIGNAFVFGSLYQMNDISRAFTSIILVLCSFVFFVKSLRVDVYLPLLHNPMFWFCCAVFIYFSINLFYFLFFNQVLMQDKSLISFGIQLHAVVNILCNLLYAKSFQCFNK
jgi:hypothetical protein